jgi:hypothetical protein
VTARILDVTPDEYHVLPGLSSSIAKVVIAKSPLHAKCEADKKPTKEMDFGSVVHRIALGAGKAFEVLDYDSYRTNDAKADRDAARAKGLVPILADDYRRSVVAAKRVVEELGRRGIELDGLSECAIEWFEPTEFGPVQCRAMFDHVWFDRGRVLDLKITGDASPAFVQRNSENLGYAIQQAAYRRGLVALRPELAGREDFLFAFGETDEPFAMNLTRPDGMMRELGERRWLRAVHTWARCMAEDKFPGYGDDINPLSPPPWALSNEDFAA